MQKYDAGAQARIDRAMKSADLILLTHEHSDHIGGLIALAGDKGSASVMNAVRLGNGQTTSSGARCQSSWPSGQIIKSSIPAGAPAAIAPGVVVIPAPSHTPGSQMIFVRLESGRRYLFTGDIATMDKSWRELRARSRLVGEHITSENRTEVFSWLLTIRKLKSEDPSLTIIPGHDFEWLADPANKANLVALMR
jgi:glyoxylase-like metal-dependent hydrolase (beta-lactamase superfamily II)